MSRRYATIFCLMTTFLIPSFAKAQNNPCNPCSKKGVIFQVKDPMGRNSVTFKSAAPLEDITGTSSQITGYISFDPDKPDMGGHGKLTVPVATLKTGIPMRDEHLLGAEWLDAGKFPNISLDIKSVKTIKETKSTSTSITYDVTIEGDFSLHGMTKSLTIPGRITYLQENEQTKMMMEGNLLAARANFNIALKDFGVPSPEREMLIGSRVGGDITLDISFIGTTAMAMAANPCNPCGEKAMNPCNPCSSNKK
ncbi:MAG: YceI family protein [Candidatus Latescibacteria bacterium]|nr:YceI family protein [Candidatus Latescibacterota bacterium]